MGKFVFAMMITASLVINAPSSAFGQLGDGQQKGFQLGAGGVVGHTTINYSGGGTDDALSYGANLYIGYGLTN